VPHGVSKLVALDLGSVGHVTVYSRMSLPTFRKMEAAFFTETSVTILDITEYYTALEISVLIQLDLLI
jgi:hypothetical protein